MTNYFVTTCRYCQDTIELREIGENRWMPFNYNGIRHNCKERQRK